MKNVVSQPHNETLPALLGHSIPVEDAEGFYVYILGNETNGKLAVSMAQDIATRVRNQKRNLHPRDFTSVNSIHTLLYVESFSDICDALARYSHLRRIDANDLSSLVEEKNPDWRDLFEFYT